jgi:hypothetical protein
VDNVRTVVHQSDRWGAGFEEQINVIQEQRILTVEHVQSSHSKVIPHQGRIQDFKLGGAHFCY